jgi:hypothetical protein
MSSPCKKLKKSNDEEEHRNKTANEKWVEGYNYFFPRKVKMNIREETKNGRHVLGNTEKRLVIILMHQFQILLAHSKCIQTGL